MLANIISIGLDAVEISRFKDWHKFDQKQLSKVFSRDEINYALSVKTKSAERFAVRFSAKEAAYKALSQFFSCPISFSKFAKFIEVKKDNCTGYPSLEIDWQNLSLKNIFSEDDSQKILKTTKQLKTNLSLTHTKTTAIALVIIYI